MIDDAPPVLEGETAEFVVRLSAASGRVVAVSYATADGTARAGSDYRSRSGRLRFEPGETARTVTVPALEDGVSEAEETFTVELRAPRRRPWPTGPAWARSGTTTSRPSS